MRIKKKGLALWLALFLGVSSLFEAENKAS